MKEIYAITLDDDVPLSSEVNNDIREIASLLYDELDRYDYHILLLRDDNKLLRNDLLESYSYADNTYHYSFVSDKSSVDYRLYEPFMLNSRTFAFTAYEDTVKEDDILTALYKAMRFLGKEYKFKIASIKYEANKDRNNAISKLSTNIKQNKEKKLVRKRINPILTMLKI